MDYNRNFTVRPASPPPGAPPPAPEAAAPPAEGPGFCGNTRGWDLCCLLPEYHGQPCQYTHIAEHRLTLTREGR